MTAERPPHDAALLGLLLAPALPLVAWPFASKLVMSPTQAAALTFAGGVTAALLPLALAAPSALTKRVMLALVALGAVGLAVAALLVPRGIASVAIVDGSLVAIAHAVGGSIGRRVAHPGHLLPA